MGTAAALALVLALPSLDPADARHLLARTEFGPTRAEVEALAPLSREQAVDAVLGSLRTTASTPPPPFAPLFPRTKPDSREARDALREERVAEAIALKTWWAQEMLATPSPFTERLTLFWSNHFTSSVQKVKAPSLLFEQNAMLRREGAGNFATLLRDVVDDRAMLVYLDGARNKAAAPNENFARELLELFTLGEGHYTERDVQEGARALSGTTIAPRSGILLHPWRRHDHGQKTFLGVTGDLDESDVVDIILAQPRTADFIVDKLWREFVSPTPDAREVKRLAADFRKSWEIKPLLRALLLSDAFWAPDNRGALVKSPLELVVGAARSLELLDDDDGQPEPLWVARTARALGQDLFDPPNVKGWRGGERWVTTMTLPARERLARDAVAATRLKDDDPRVPLATLLLPLPPVDGDGTLEGIARDPAFQLK